MIGFSVEQVARFTGLTARQLKYADATGLLAPSVQADRGRGKRRLYSFPDLVALRLIARLRLQGVSLQAIRKAVSYLHQLGREELPSMVLAVVDDDVTLVTPKQLAVSLVRRPGQLCFLIDLRGITEEVEAAIRAVG